MTRKESEWSDICSRLIISVTNVSLCYLMLGLCRTLAGVVCSMSDILVDGDEGQTLHWEMLTRILSYVQHKISLRSKTDGSDARVKDIRGLARAIRGNPMISKFSS
jgi:hypothetical protein